MFQNLIGMLGRRNNVTQIFSDYLFQNLIGMLGSILSARFFQFLFAVSKPYRYARK